MRQPNIIAPIVLIIFAYLSATSFAASATSKSTSRTIAPSPTPSSTPLAAPLGLVDMAILLRQAEEIVANSSSTLSLPPTSMSQFDFCLNQSKRYCEILSNASIGRISYRWVRAGNKKPDLAPGKTHICTPSKAVRSFAAIRFNARGGDIFVKDMTVVTTGGIRRQYPVNRWIYSDLPKREVLYLSEPADAGPVEITMYRKWQETARLVIDLGVPTPPEYTREISALCDQAQAAIAAKNITACRAALTKARERLAEYRKSNRSE